MYIINQWWKSAGDKSPTFIITVKTPPWWAFDLTGGNVLVSHSHDNYHHHEQRDCAVPDHVNVAIYGVLLLIQLLQRLVHTVLDGELLL